MIKIHNTLTQKLEKFSSLEKGKVKMYVCGPTVYNYIHIGNARPAIFFDTVRRYLEYQNYNVVYVQNFTDIDDKIIEKAKTEKNTVKNIAEKYIKAYLEDMKKINIKEKGMLRPKATDYINEMITTINILIIKGYAYENQGDVYFNVEKYKENYGVLSGQNINDRMSGIRVATSNLKKSSLDFTLWKKAKKDEKYWESPWGKGRPGWHIECSVMSKKYLGETFDIHGGGQDLIFPHHENEIAQSKCAYGGEYARYWIHNGYVNIKGEKMSKSKGNFFLLRDVLKSYKGKVIRFFLLSSHYRKPINFSEEELYMAKNAINRVENSMIEIIEKIKNIKNKEIDSDINQMKLNLEKSKLKFIESMNDDFNTSKSIGALFELIKESNIFLNNELGTNSIELLKDILNFLKTAFIDVLGIEIEIEKKDKNINRELIEILLDVRKNAKENRNFQLSDKIRDEMLKLGIEIKDGREKTTWKVSN